MFKSVTISIFLISTLVVSVFGYSANAASAPDLRDLASHVTGNRTVTLSISVDPNGSPTTLYFKYWLDSGSRTRAYNGVMGDTFTRISMGLINLNEGTIYSYQVTAENGFGSVTSPVGTFTTNGATSTGGSTGSYSGSTGSTGSTGGSTGSTTNGNPSSYSGSTSGPIAPLATTYGPASVSTNSATVNGSINPRNADTRFWFEFGLTQSLGLRTSTEQAGSGNSEQLVVGNLSGLENNRTYYYRVMAQNNFGTATGDIKSFTTGAGQFGSTNQNGQVLGVASSNTNSGSTSSSGSGSSVTRTSVASRNPRPSFVSLEYSLEGKGPLVTVADNLGPNPGEEFNYTVVYKNDTAYSFNEANLKIIIPSEANYVGSSMEPSRMSGSVVEFDLGTIPPSSQQEVVVIVRLKETVKAGTTIIFTSVLGYKDRTGTQLATTSYLTVKAGSGGAGVVGSLSAFTFGALTSSAGLLVLMSLGLIVLLGIIAYRFLVIKNGKEHKDDEIKFNRRVVPPTVEPIESPMNRADLTEAPLGRADVFQPVRR